MYQSFRIVRTGVLQSGAGFLVPATGGGGSGELASDDFNRADGPLGSNWTTVYDFGALAISSNQVTGGGGEGLVRWSGAGSFTDDQYSQVTMTAVTAGATQGVAVRLTGTSFATAKGYMCGSISTTGNLRYRIFYMNADSDFTQVAVEDSGTLDVQAGDVIKLVVTFSGGVNTLTGYRNGVAISGLIGVTDSTIGSGGKPGFAVRNIADTWSAGTP
jgi:hypothetical protein